MNLEIATLDVVGVKQLLDLARAEGWNPGVSDAEAFIASDKEGFLGLLDEGEPIAGISVVQYNESYSFLGLYLCKPIHRGKGLGIQLWRAGLTRLKGTVVGLDGVVEQQENYKKSGFDFAYRNIRFHGDTRKMSVYRDFKSFLRLATPHDIDALIAMDKAIGGIERKAYLREWFSNNDYRQTYVGYANGVLVGCATIRECEKGHKVGPLMAIDAEIAETLLKGAITISGAASVTIDIPEPNSEGIQLAIDLGLKPNFETARMYLGNAPDANLAQQFGVATLELG